MTLRPYQSDAIAALDAHLASKQSNPCVVLPTGCHTKGHPILMADGSVKEVQDIIEGDSVMGPDSTPRKVLSLHRIKDVPYKITPVKGTPFIVNAGHILSLVRTNEGKTQFKCYSRGGEIDDISVSDYLLKSKSWKHIRKLRRVPIDFADRQSLIVDPYILGVLIGDGSMIEGTSITSADAEIAFEFEKYVRSLGGAIRVSSNGSKAYTYHARIGGTKGRNTLNGALRRLGLYGKPSCDKFIPHEYLVSSRRNRLELLAGLIDTDGYIDKCVDYVTDSPRLANCILFLVRSLGFAAYSKPKFSACQTGAIGLYVRICISGDLSQIPFRRNRHKEKSFARRQKKDVLRTGFSVDRVDGEKVDFYGFELDGDHRYVDGNFTVHHNSGKSYVMAESVRHWKEPYPPFRCIVLAHRKELVEQNANELRGIYPEGDIGIYAAGLGAHETEHAITFAGIDSVYNKAGHFRPFDVIIVDEAHRIPVRGEGKYRRFIQDCKAFNPYLRVVGFTATPYRLGSGPICHKDYILNEVCYEANVGDLIRDGYLCPLRSKVSESAPNLSKVKKTGGDYNGGELGRAVRADGLVERAVHDALFHLDGRHCVVWFCVDVSHMESVLQQLESLGECVAAVSGSTSVGERDAAVERFRSGQCRHILNVNVFTEGFNVKQVDAIVLLRPTLSRGLFAQMVGRGLRLHANKSDCLVLDYAHCIETHGPIDAPYDGTVRVEVCAKCREVFARGIRKCPKCGWEIPKQVIEERERVEREKKLHEERAAQLAILGSVPQYYPVSAATVNFHTKDGKSSLCVTYRCGIQTFREWVCLDHDGYAGNKAKTWWLARFPGTKVPSVNEALTDMFLGHEITKVTEGITVRRNGKYNEIISHTLRQ